MMELDVSGGESLEYQLHYNTWENEKDISAANPSLLLTYFTRKRYETTELRREGRINHGVQVNGQAEFECEQCHEGFYAEPELKLHLKTHAGQKDYECHQCLNRFTSKSNVNVHLKIHSGQKDYECKYCQKRFVQKYNLKRHLNIHKDLELHSAAVTE